MNNLTAVPVPDEAKRHRMVRVSQAREGTKAVMARLVAPEVGSPTGTPAAVVNPLKEQTYERQTDNDKH